MTPFEQQNCLMSTVQKAVLQRSTSRGETGSQIVEFGLVLLPLMAFLFLIIDVGWLCFAQSTLQHAVQVGVRSAVTGYVPSGVSGQDAYVKSIVQQNAMGFLYGQTGLSEITINYFSPANLSQPLSGSGSNIGGNVIQVSVKNVPVSALGPILRESSAQLLLNATASDIMESSPNGIPPTR